MTALIIRKPVFAYPRVNWRQLGSSEGERKPSEKQEVDEEVDRVFPRSVACKFLEAGGKKKQQHPLPGAHYNT